MEPQRISEILEKISIVAPDAASLLTKYKSEKPEEYILTKEEEETVVRNYVNSLRERNSLRLQLRGLSIVEADAESKKSILYTDLEIKEILSIANAAKHQQLFHKEQRDKERQMAEEKKIRSQEMSSMLRKKWNPEYMYDFIKSESIRKYKRDFVLYDWNKSLVTSVCYFVSRDDRFCSDLGYDPSKGLLIRGVSDLGKTFVVSCISENEYRPVKIFSTLEINDEILSKGSFLFSHDNAIFCLEDVGTEQPFVIYYGTRICFFKEFIEKTNLRQTDYSNLIITTNLSFGQIEEIYGFRVSRRVRSMFNVVDVKGRPDNHKW